MILLLILAVLALYIEIDQLFNINLIKQIEDNAEELTERILKARSKGYSIQLTRKEKVFKIVGPLIYFLHVGGWYAFVILGLFYESLRPFMIVMIALHIVTNVLHYKYGEDSRVYKVWFKIDQSLCLTIILYSMTLILN